MDTELHTPPANFRTVVADFIQDLSTTFPEFSYLWLKWGKPDLSDADLQTLYDYCMTVYPERFFDILNQNEEIFDTTNETNTVFLPNVDFKLLFNCKDISETTTKALWKYLQLMLFTIVGGIKDKANFGDTMNLFDDINPEELHTKLSETMKNMSEFFENMSQENKERSQQDSSSESGADASSSEAGSGPGTANQMPDIENLQDHLKGLFDGKIGKLAKEMAEDISDDFTELLGENAANMKTTEDVMKELMKNPAKIMNLMKKVGGKLDEKMKNGDISKDEIMKEAGELMKKMKGMGNFPGGDGQGGMEGFADMFKNMAKGMGKNMKVDTNAMERMTKQQAMKEKMLAKLRAKQAAAASLAQDAAKKAEYTLQPSTTAQNELVFRLDGAEAQEKSYIHPDILKEMAAEEKKASEKKGGEKKGKSKKGKK